MVHRGEMTAEEVHSLQPMRPPANLQGWSEDKFGVSRLFTGGEFGNLANVWFSKNLVEAFVPSRSRLGYWLSPETARVIMHR